MVRPSALCQRRSSTSRYTPACSSARRRQTRERRRIGHVYDVHAAGRDERVAVLGEGRATGYELRGEPVHVRPVLFPQRVPQRHRARPVAVVAEEFHPRIIGTQPATPAAATGGRGDRLSTPIIQGARDGQSSNQYRGTGARPGRRRLRLSRRHARAPPELPAAAFSGFEVETGGVGAGTVIRFNLAAGGRTRQFRSEIAEPEPGRVLTESDTNSSAVTTFTVMPAGDNASVRIDCEWNGASGIGGFFERTFAPRVMRGILADELTRLDAYARNEQAGPDRCRTAAVAVLGRRGAAARATTLRTRFARPCCATRRSCWSSWSARGRPGRRPRCLTGTSGSARPMPPR